MLQKKHKPEEIVAKELQVDVLTSQGQSVAEAVRSSSVTPFNYYRWCKQSGDLRACLARWAVQTWSGIGSRVLVGMRASYPSSLTDAQWALVRDHLPDLATGRRRRWPPRLVLDAVFYLVRTGCQWRQLPRDFPPWQTVYYHCRRWDGRGLLHRLHEALRRAVRVRHGRQPDASAGVMDSQSVRTTQTGGVRGFNGGKGVQGRKRHLLVDTEGLVVSQEVSAAHVSDQAGARRLLSGLRPLQPRLELIWADGA